MSDSGSGSENPESKASCFNKLFFCWVLPIFKVGIKNDLKLNDLYKPVTKDVSKYLGNSLECYWTKELENAKKKRKNPSLKRAMFKMIFWPFFGYGVILFFQSIVLRLGLPLVLAEFLKFFSKNKPYSVHEGYILAGALILILMLNQLVSHHMSVSCCRIGIRCKIACCTLMFKKLLRLNKTAMSRTDTGQVVNLMSNDVQRFETLFLFLHYVWITPIQAAVAGYFMYRELGYAALVGILFIAIQGIPIQGFLSRRLGKLRGKIATQTDHRVKLMSEIIYGIKTVKIYTWEKIMENMIKLIRKSELNYINKKYNILGFMTSLMVFTERTSLFFAIVIYAVNGNLISSYLVFSMAQYFNIIQLYMAIFFPLGLTCYAEANISFKRIKQFLLLPEYPKQTNFSEVSEIGSIKLMNCKATWLPNPIIWTLSNINLEIEPGSLCIVVGSVGSGKSSLLQLLLRELPLGSGIMNVNGHVSYTSEEPWLFNASVKKNILFGKPYVGHIYNKVIRVCALSDDLEQFPYGDKTNVGEYGRNLSGGQKARVNLARAVYSWADIYLFDDPLAAVDNIVSKHIFQKCILKYLKKKTRILITHQMQYLEFADKIVLMKNGQIDRITTFKELTTEELKDLAVEVTAVPVTDDIEEEEVVNSKRVKSNSLDNIVIQSMEEIPKLEEMEKGNIRYSTYLQYFLAGFSIPGMLFLSLIILSSQIICNGGDLWLRQWTNEEEKYCTDGKTLLPVFSELIVDDGAPILELTNQNFTNTLNETLKNNLENLVRNQTNLECSDYFSRHYYIYVYTAFIVLTIILLILRSLFFFKLCVSSSRNLHSQMLGNVLSATMKFFNTNSSGRILNAFSKDMGAIDEVLPKCMLDCIQIFVTMIGILTMVFIVSPIMIVPCVVLSAMFIFVRYVYMATARSLKRLEGITRSPLYSHVSSSMLGITTIRSCKAEVMVENEFADFQDENSSASIWMIFTSETFGFYLDVICVIFITIITFQFFFYNNVVSGDVGLAISQALILAGMLQHGVRQSTEVSNNMISVERVLQYTKIDNEDTGSSKEKPVENWPERGAIEIKNLNLYYQENMPAVLKNINLKIEAGEKIGIVGRTGAGKSSLVSAIFRLVGFEGQILIDGIDTKQIPLADLRKKISIIPQEPVLFSNNIRENLNPEKSATDEEIWSALEKVELKNTIDSLEHEVSEGGSNFSTGQKQLLCIARAILRNNKIILLDEATANLDTQTDELIQKTIKKNFSDCTVLTIAHRLNTIMDADRVIVLHNGEVVQFDTPQALLETDGLFANMAK